MKDYKLRLTLIDKLSNVLGRIVGDSGTESEDSENIAHLIYQLCTEKEITEELIERVAMWQINTSGINE